MRGRRFRGGRLAAGLFPFAAAVLIGGAPGSAGAALQPSPPALDAVFEAWDRDDSPGCAAGALRRGEFVFRGAYGMANLDHGVPLTADSVFRMASVSKQFTAAAVLAAEDRGLLSLEDPIRKHLPELPGWADPVRVRHLLHHTSGIRDYLVVMTLRGHGPDAHYTDAAVLTALQSLERRNFEPGTEYLYSNSGYWLLGELLRRVSGRTLREFAAEALFTPLGMDATHFHDRHREIVPGRASGYRPRPEADGGGFELDRTTLEMVGDGGLYTTLNDLRYWEGMFLDPGRLGPRFERRLVEPGRFSDGSLQDYAAGLGLGEYRELRTVSHGGGFVGFRTHSLRFPEREFAVFVLCNAANADPGTLARRVADLFLADALAPPEPELPGLRPDAAPVAPGRFWERASASLASIGTGDRTEEGGALFLIRDGRNLPLGLAGGRLVASSGSVRVRLLPRGDGFVLRQQGRRDFHYTRVEPWEPAVEERAGLAGAYRCRELEVTYEVREGPHPGLTLSGGGEARTIEPVFLDRGGSEPGGAAPVYAWPGGTVRFLPDPDPDRGARGFELSLGRARGFLFVRK